MHMHHAMHKHNQPFLFRSPSIHSIQLVLYAFWEYLLGEGALGQTSLGSSEGDATTGGGEHTTAVVTNTLKYARSGLYMRLKTSRISYTHEHI